MRTDQKIYGGSSRAGLALLEELAKDPEAFKARLQGLSNDDFLSTCTAIFAVVVLVDQVRYNVLRVEKDRRGIT